MIRESHTKSFVDPIEPVTLEDVLPMQQGHVQELQSPGSNKMKKQK